MGMGIATWKREGMGIDSCGKIPAQHNSFSRLVSDDTKSV